ncbi:MAG: hypothetical protein U1D96_05215 [Eubacteriales bacterium]|nr:hypothetical protein [Bacillota bacterium]MBV1726719.1 hypothetical protein [Desulforudis sp.]MDP3050578.1 hypothetical protein [Eubacteriales bacterium]MDQ7788970.1 hypothetical protein [Clostridia bacterium]MBV1734686.1 hypothetical protein [Desulforudis sp.]
MGKNKLQETWALFDNQEFVLLPDGTYIPIEHLTDEERLHLDLTYGRVIVWVPHGRKLVGSQEILESARKGRTKLRRREGGIHQGDLLKRIETKPSRRR